MLSASEASPARPSQEVPDIHRASEPRLPMGPELLTEGVLERGEIPQIDVVVVIDVGKFAGGLAHRLARSGEAVVKRREITQIDERGSVLPRADDCMTDEQLYHELCLYTLAHHGSEFIHQHVVDAFAAQHAGEGGKPIAITFALVGLYLAVEKGFSGKQVQQAHMRLAKKKKTWPSFDPPEDRAAFTLAEVMRAAPGEERDRAIRKWCESVWTAYRVSHQPVADLVSNLLGIS